MLGPWKLTIQSHGTSLHKAMDASQENTNSEGSNNPKLDTKEQPNADDIPKQEPRPSLLDSLFNKEHVSGKKLRILKKED